MRNLYLCIALLCLLLFPIINFAQSSGFINRPATSVGGRDILDPNGDGYTSTGTSGFGTNDVTNSELIYNGIKAYSTEPYGDLRRGPSHRFTDFVPDNTGNGVYFRISPAQQVMFRMRLGSVISGSKGYSILMDTDGKFGATGPNADPNYLPSTTGVNGNPGFEIEIVLETNFRIAIYNADGTSSPVMIKQYTNWQDMSQISIAGTNDNGDPDFFIDFYIPFSDLQAAPFNLTTSSSIRMSATTVMAPQSAIGGPKSDIYGTSGNNYDDFIDGQPGCNIFTTPYTCSIAMCTAAPVVNSPLSTGIVNISGKWTKSALPGAAATASITVYKNGSALSTITNITSGSTWTLNSITLLSGDIITAKAQATGESMCLVSNSVVASACNSLTVPATPTLTCTSGSKGLEGTNLSSGWTVHVDNLTRNVLDNNVSNSTGLFGTQTGTSPNITWIFSGGCGTGAPLSSGSYKVYYTNNVTGCNSLPSYFCATGNGGSSLAGSLAVPTITSPSNLIFTTATTSISGTTDANAVVYLYVNKINTKSTTATGGNFNFTGLTLLPGDQLYISAELNTGTISTSKCQSETPLYTVTCFTQAPLINADNNNQLTSGAPITGTSTEAAGTIIRVYTSGSVLTATTPVQANGTWSTGNASTTPAVYNAIAGTSYYANAQNGSCGVSVNSATYTAATGTSNLRCGTITGPVTSGASNISGTLTGSFTTTTVNLYLDDQLIGTTTTTNNLWGPITVNTTINNTLYSNGVLSIGIQESSKQEIFCPGSSLSILCTPTPTVPVYTMSGTVNQYQTTTVTISNAVTGTFYALSDSATGQSFGQGKWAAANGTLVLTTNAFNTPGTYKVKVSSSSVTGVSVCSASASSPLIVNAVVVPLSLTAFTGRRQSAYNLLEWKTENEINVNRLEVERSDNSVSFKKIGSVNATGFGGAYNYLDVAPLKGVNYYRLKMIDNDGNYKFSNIIILINNEKDNVVISNVSPNPFTDKIHFTISVNESQNITLQLFDFAGRKCSSKSAEVKQGSNEIEFGGFGLLAPGVYYLNVNMPHNVIQQKIIKLN